MKDIVVFGTGQVGRDIISYLEEKDHILYVVDNDEKKWGSSFEKYTVESPEKLKQVDCDIIVASTRYRREIFKQLLQMGIRQSRIYYVCRKNCACHLDEYKIYPLDVERLMSTKLPLIEYDLFHSQEQKTKHIKVLIFCRSFSVYPKQLIENMSKRYGDIEFSLITKSKEYREKVVVEQLKHIYCYDTMADLKSILEQIPIYNVIQLLWIENEWAYFHGLIRMKAVQLSLLIGGSDFYRADMNEREYKRKLIRDSDAILAVTTTVAQEFTDYYGQEVKNKIVLLHYGKEVLNYIDFRDNDSINLLKQKYGIPLDKIVITCGHNANEAHQHIDMINALKKLRDNIKEKIVCVFPMTYPSGLDEYIHLVKNCLKESKLDHVILTEFMDFQSMAEYAMVSDIMLHVQITDLLSSAMIEEMYAGSIIIAGSWLPYQALHDMGVYFLDVDTIPNVTEILEDVVMNMEMYREKCKGNKDIIWEHASWDILAPKWYELWKHGKVDK